MNLRQRAAADLVAILENAAAGFGWKVTVTNPAGVSYPLVGQSGDVGKTIDPETGLAIAGRTAHLSLAISSLTKVRFAIPSNVSDESGKPWLVAFDDINGNPQTYKVSHAFVDRTLGIVTCLLEAYVPCRSRR